MQDSRESEYRSMEDLFRPIREFRNISFSSFLRKILEYRGVNVIELHKMLIKNEYHIELESLYRYFNPGEQSNRFPPKDFLKAFSICLNLTDEQTDLLILFWSNVKLYKKIQRKVKKKFYSES